jgi:hypothetical protein
VTTPGSSSSSVFVQKGRYESSCYVKRVGYGCYLDYHLDDAKGEWRYPTELCLIKVLQQRFIYTRQNRTVVFSVENEVYGIPYIHVDRKSQHSKG